MMTRRTPLASVPGTVSIAPPALTTPQPDDPAAPDFPALLAEFHASAAAVAEARGGPDRRDVLTDAVGRHNAARDAVVAALESVAGPGPVCLVLPDRTALALAHEPNDDPDDSMVLLVIPGAAEFPGRKTVPAPSADRQVDQLVNHLTEALIALAPNRIAGKVWVAFAILASIDAELDNHIEDMDELRRRRAQFGDARRQLSRILDAHDPARATG